MNGIELGALCQLLHISRVEAAQISPHRHEAEWHRWESSKDAVPSSLALEVQEWSARFFFLLDHSQANFTPDVIVEHLEGFLEETNGDFDEALLPDQSALLNCLVSAVIGHLILGGDVVFPKNGPMLQRVRRSLFLSVKEAAEEIGATTEFVWTAWEASPHGEEIPEDVWSQIQLLGRYRGNSVSRFIGGNAAPATLLKSAVRTAYLVWFGRFEDFVRFNAAQANRPTVGQWRALQSAYAELFGRDPGQRVSVVFDMQEFSATPLGEGDQFIAWMKAAAIQKRESLHDRREEESLFYVPPGQLLH